MTTLFPNPVNPRFGGFVARSLEALARREDWRVTVVNPIGIPPVALGRYRSLAKLPDHSQETGISIYRQRFTLIPKLGARRNASAIAKAALPLIERIHAQTPIDVLDAQFFFPDGPAAAWIAHKLNIPLSIKARGSDISYWGEQDFAREQMLEAAECADGLLAVSQALTDEMVAIGMPRSKIRLHYTGLDRNRFRPLNHTGLRAKLANELQFDLPEAVPMLACVGALIERKGQDIAIAALPTLPEARLVLVGKGDDEGHLRNLAKDLGVAERVHFAGSIDHDLLPIILSAADLMVLPTQTEGLANAWVEALACGTRVITTDVGGARELITSETSGLLAERTPEAITAAARTLLENPVPSADVAATADRFSWERNGQELADHYAALISRAGQMAKS
ncbi:MAG: glycosyltransferase [Erythrobacter sp.]